jgi:phosphoribosyl 1,2-cyclic phosphodiesterase
MKGFCPLASGSTGNCIFVGTEKTKLLFDVGISYKVAKERLEEIQVSIDDIDAVVISHEHFDHIKGLEMIVKKRQIPIFCNSDTAKAICQLMEVRPKFKIFSTGESFYFGDVEIHPFSIQHDTLDPVAFTLQYNDIKFAICTDLGFVTKLVEMHLKDCDYLYIEANHDEDMVHACSRPMVYKQRVLSRQGHLSNRACAELLDQIYHTDLKHVFLAHLSSECNHPDLAIQTIRDFLAKKNKTVTLSIAYPDKISQPIYFVKESKRVDISA